MRAPCSPAPRPSSSVLVPILRKAADPQTWSTSAPSDGRRRVSSLPRCARRCIYAALTLFESVFQGIMLYLTGGLYHAFKLGFVVFLFGFPGSNLRGAEWLYDNAIAEGMRRLEPHLRAVESEDGAGAGRPEMRGERQEVRGGR